MPVALRRLGTAALAILCALTLTFGGCARAPRKSQIPASTIAPFPPTEPGPLIHTVLRGQTLYRIAKNYNVTVDELMLVNGIKDPSQLEVGQRLRIPGVGGPVKPYAVRGPEPVSLDDARRLIGPRRAYSDWRTITLHHSATEKGSAKNFHRDHTRRHMGGLFYHFVIGNGSYTRDGQIEVGWRWQRQVKANRPYDIQICLVGDFSRHGVSDAQFNSLANLLAALCKEYRVPLSRVRRHGDIKGKHTACPGRFFPFSRLLERLQEMGLAS